MSDPITGSEVIRATDLRGPTDGRRGDVIVLPRVEVERVEVLNNGVVIVHTIKRYPMQVNADALVRVIRDHPTVHVHSRQDDGSWTEDDIVCRTASGRVLTEDDLDALADEAEHGYDVKEQQ